MAWPRRADRGSQIFATPLLSSLPPPRLPADKHTLKYRRGPQCSLYTCLIRRGRAAGCGFIESWAARRQLGKTQWRWHWSYISTLYGALCSSSSTSFPLPPPPPPPPVESSFVHLFLGRQIGTCQAEFTPAGLSRPYSVITHQNHISFFWAWTEAFTTQGSCCGRSMRSCRESALLRDS